jgi:hypothetical protein
MLRPLVAALAACALAPAAAAPGATLTLDGAHTMHYTAAPGEENRLSMWVLDVGYGIVKDDGFPGLTGCDGPLIMAGWRHCVIGRRPQVKLGDMDDVANIADGGSDEGMWIGAANVDGGSGDDDIRTGDAADVILGGAGNDTLRGFQGANRLEGGDGDDTLISFYSDDTKIGGPGADTFEGHDGNETIDAADGAATDTITCHGGTDTVKADEGDTIGPGCDTVTLVPKPSTGGGDGSDGPGPGGGGKDDDAPAPGGDRPSQPAEPAPPAPRDPGGPAAPDRPLPPAADATPPKLTVKAKRRRGRTVLTVTSDEAATLSGAGRKVRRLTAGRALRVVLRAKRLRLVAHDAAGNATVKRVRVRGR